MVHRFVASAFAAALAFSVPASAAAPLAIKYIGQQVLPTATFLNGTQVGGLSGIEYVGGNSFIADSDDRSQFGPARYYSIDLALSSTAFTGVTITNATTYKTPAGTDYATLQIDPESIRRTPTGNIVYTSEGDTNRGIDAFIREAKADGTFVRDYTLPAGYQQTGPTGTTGIRNNLAFESLTFANNGRTLVTATENALRQDGPAAAFGVGSPSRLLTFDTATGQPGAQFVYNVDPVAAMTNPAGGFSTNGLVELLSLGGTKYLALERSFVSGLVTPVSATGNGLKIYQIDTAGATDVSGLSSLTGQNYTAVSKELVFDLGTLGIPLDNLEGVTFGPTLENGRRSLILVSDNNFSPTQFTQFIAFQIGGVPEAATWVMVITGFGAVGARLRRRRASVAFG